MQLDKIPRTLWIFVTRRVLTLLVTLSALSFVGWSIALGTEMAKVVVVPGLVCAFLSAGVYAGAKVVENTILGRIEFNGHNVTK